MGLVCSFSHLNQARSNISDEFASPRDIYRRIGHAFVMFYFLIIGSCLLALLVIFTSSITLVTYQLCLYVNGKEHFLV